MLRLRVLAVRFRVSGSRLCDFANIPGQEQTLLMQLQSLPGPQFGGCQN